MAVTLPRLDKAQIKKIARAHAPAYKLYHGGRKWFKHEYSGNMYWFPPDLGGKLVEHPAYRTEKRQEDGTITLEPVLVKADGILEVRDRYGVIYGKRAVPVTHPVYGYSMGWGLPVEDPEGKLEEESADKVVTFFTSKFGIEVDNPTMALGITLLTGDPETDEDIKRESRKIHLTALMAWAEAERSKRMLDVAEWKAKNPGRNDVPPMNPRQIEAEEILMLAEEDKRMSTFSYACSCGGYETDDKEKFDRHVRLRHPERFAPAPETFESRDPYEEVGAFIAEPVTPAKKRGRPKGSTNKPKIAS